MARTCIYFVCPRNFQFGSLGVCKYFVLYAELLIIVFVPMIVAVHSSDAKFRPSVVLPSNVNRERRLSGAIDEEGESLVYMFNVPPTPSLNDRDEHR